MQRRLPPLNSVRAFEAAARLGSFSRAADELHVTHGAVSRHVQLLENWLGTPLFRRQNRRVELTDPGRVYLAEVGAALDRIASATAQHLERGRGRLLRVNATTTLTLRWLIPRLSGFQLANPSIEIRITTSNEVVEALGSEFDVIIRQPAREVAGCVIAFFYGFKWLRFARISAAAASSSSSCSGNNSLTRFSSQHGSTYLSESVFV